MSPLNIIVCVKQVLDTRQAIEVSESGEVVQKEPWPVYLINPADRCALEEAVRLRDEAGGGSVTAVTLGGVRTGSVLAHCLARGADQALHVLADKSAYLDSFSVARVLSDVIRKRNFDLILCGNKTEDDGASEVGSVLAELLDIAQVTNVVKLRVSTKNKKLEAERKLERGYRQVVEANLPAMVTVDTSICQPRYVTVRASSYRAKKLSQDAERIYVEDLNLFNNSSKLRSVVGHSPPRPRPKKIVRPDAGVSPAEKMALLMGLGGAGPKKTTQSSKGGPEGLADEIIDFLKEKGLFS